MTRKKVKLAYITNDSARKATFKKRKKGFLKKLDELTILCDIDVCSIIYSPYDSQPEVFPSPLGAQRMISKFKRMPQMEQCKKMVNQEGLIKQRISKINDQFMKLRKDNREKDMTRVMFQSLIGVGLHGLTILDLNDLSWLIVQNLKDIQKRIETLNKEAARGLGQVQVVPKTVAASAPTLASESDPRMMINMDVMMQRQPWFTDMVNPQESIGFDGEGMIMPVEEQNYNSIWSNYPFLP
uniref:MADS38 n=1 Tax=Hippophae rhamnoides TaxID=193516 RepID=A0AAU7LJD0_9ROSA